MAKINSTTDRFNGNAAKNLTVLNGTQVSSDFLNMDDFTLCGLIMAGSITSTTLNFTGSVDGVNFYQLKNSAGTALSVTVSSGAGFYKLDPSDFVGVEFIKITTSSPEGAGRTITLVGCDILNG